MTIYLISFGYLHAPAPEADRTEDVRRRLRDPAAARDVLDLDGHNPAVQAIVEHTPGATDLLDNLVSYCDVFTGDITIAIGCAGGRHRAPSLIELLAKRLGADHREIRRGHRDIHRPRVLN